MIRKAATKDISEIVKLGRAMHEESTYSKFIFSEKQLELLINIWLEEPEKYFFVVDEKDGEIRGGFAGFITPYFYGNGSDKIANDFFLYVKPEYRGTSIAIKLIKEYEEWANNLGAKRICLAHSCEINPDKLDNLYTKMGFVPYANAFKKGD